MDKACVLKHKVLESPLGKIEVSGCDQGLHWIRLLSPKTSTDPVQAPAAPEVVSGPEGTSEPLMRCAAWLDAYFHKPTAIEGLPLPALHHPVFQKGWYLRLTR
uniref:methylated-DNA--protein-cysteine methyltransferase n=1 Tax=Callospermophilus lateralis TaxID=76772 RepID=UPI004038E1FE